MKNWKTLMSESLEKYGYASTEAQKILLMEMEAIKFFKFEGVIPDFLKLENIERSESKIIYYWSSNSSQAECADCQTVSHHERHDYKTKLIQDIASDGCTVQHNIRLKRWYCENPKCPTKIFVERFFDFAEEKSRKTLRFKERCKKLALSCGGLGAERELRSEGSVVSDDTILRYVKSTAAAEIKSNLTRDDVKILSIDDFNTRKGDRSSGCTVFIDHDTRKVLIIVKGTTKEAVQKVMERFPSTEFLSRDRACGFSSAGDACGKKQVADRFHLFQNIHKAINDALMAEIPANIFLREGDGWVELKGEHDNEKVIYTVPEEDLEKRIQLAGLTEVKAEKYRNTLKMLELSDKGLRTADIAKALGITHEAVKVLRRSAASTIQEVHDKINSRVDKYPKNADGRGRPPTNGEYKTLGANPKPAHESIVEPYRDIVVEMWNAGYSYTKIHPIIAEKGFKGSKNAVYQYIWKLEYEVPCVLTRKIKRNKPGTPWVDGFDKQEAQDLPELLLEKVPRNSLYKSILKQGKSARENYNQPEDETKHNSVPSFTYSAGSTEKSNQPTISNSSLLEQERMNSIYEANYGQPEDGTKTEGIEVVLNNADCIEKKSPAKIKSKKPAMSKYSPLEPEYLDLMYGTDDDERTEEEIVSKEEAIIENISYNKNENGKKKRFLKK